MGEVSAQRGKSQQDAHVERHSRTAIALTLLNTIRHVQDAAARRRWITDGPYMALGGNASAGREGSTKSSHMISQSKERYLCRML